MTPAEQSAQALKVCQLAPVVPVLVIDDLAHARPLAEALVKGGLPAREVTLRSMRSAPWPRCRAVRSGQARF
jgi:2-dehydro-3-deoxyphosphogluconate aldolase/(4S)-4-hydroxy-2-oxoglutarate aldolase